MNEDLLEKLVREQCHGMTPEEYARKLERESRRGHGN